MKRGIGVLMAAALVYGLLVGSASAQEKDVVIPLTLQDMSGKSNVNIALPMVPHDNFFGMSPRLSGQYGLGNMAFGLQVPLSMAFPDEGDTGFGLGNITLEGKFHQCTGGQWAICYGGGLALSAGFLEADESEVRAAHMSGAVGHQSWTYHYYESLVIRPLGFVAITDGAIFGQAEFGAAIGIPIVNTDGKDSHEAAILWAFGAGYKLMDMIAPMIEFRGLSPVTEDGLDSYLWLNFGARFYFGSILPMVRLSIPLTDEASLGGGGQSAPVQFELGCMFQF